MKYYTVCLFSPSRTTFTRVGSSQGLLFHDTENAVDIKEVVRALRRLPRNDNNKQALVVNVDANTVAATLSTEDVPKPTRQRGYFHRNKIYLDQYNTTGHIIKDLDDPNSIEAINYSELYHNCTRMERLMGTCPCPDLATGQCFNTVVAPNCGLNNLEDYEPVLEDLIHRSKEYKTLGSFEYIPPSYTTPNTFEESLRNWDQHDFDVITDKKSYYKAKGLRQREDNRFRKEHCQFCVFNRSTYRVDSTDCGLVRSCDGHTTQEQAWIKLYKWLYELSGFMDMPGFSAKERNYLISCAGKSVKTAAITEGNKIDAFLGGFMTGSHRAKVQGTEWLYRVSASKGDKYRYVMFDNYKTLAEDTGLPKSEDLPDITLTPKVLLMVAAMGNFAYVHKKYKGQYPKVKIELYADHSVASTCTNSRCHDYGSTLASDAGPKEIWGCAFGYTYDDADSIIK